MAVHKPVAYGRVRPVGNGGGGHVHRRVRGGPALGRGGSRRSLWIIRPVHPRSEEHTSELQSLMRISYAVFCLKKKTSTLTNQLANAPVRTSVPHHHMCYTQNIT